MQITSKDVIWNYLSTFLRTASSIVLLPVILKLLPAQEIGLWTIFTTIGTIVTILDFGFAPSFSRNITFIFSGVTKLKAEGFDYESSSGTVDFNLLKTTLKAMQYFYLRIASIVFILLVSLGTLYINHLLEEFDGSHLEIYIAWSLFISIVSFNMYTDYYEALLIGRGLIKESKQIVIISQLVYLALACLTLLLNCGLVGLFGSQLVAVVITRLLSYRRFYTYQIQAKLRDADIQDFKGILKVIYPNAIKSGINSIGSIFIYRAPLLIGSVHFSLAEIGSYGLTRQIFDIVYLVASTYSITYFPQFSSNWMNGKLEDNRTLYVKSLLLGLCVYVSFVCGIALFANSVLSSLGSKTYILTDLPLAILSINYLFTFIHGQSVPVIVSKNVVPLYYVGLIGGIVVMCFTLVLLNMYPPNVLALVVPPTIVYLAYENWKWPLLAFRALEMDIGKFVNISKGVIVNTVTRFADIMLRRVRNL